MATKRMTAAEYRRLGRSGRTTPETALKRAAVEWLRLQGWLTYPLAQHGTAVARAFARALADGTLVEIVEIDEPRSAFPESKPMPDVEQLTLEGA